MAIFSRFSSAFGCYTETNINALSQNYKLICDYVQSKSPNVRVAAVVKADAYGHGVERCARALYDVGCRFFCVATLEEAFKVYFSIKQNCDILILEATEPRFATVLAAYGFIQSVFSEEQALAMNNELLTQPLRVHIKLDTGMNRKGFRCGADAAQSIVSVFSQCKKLAPEGVFSHIYDSSSRERSEEQLSRFDATVRTLEKSGLSLPTKHISSSEPMFFDKKYMLNLIRSGMMLYGYGKHADELSLTPAMKFYGTVEEIHKIRAGESVGYGGDFVAERDVLVVTVSGGYSDGILRAYSGAHVKILTERGEVDAKICGRICMDSFAVVLNSECDGEAVRVGDRVRLFGGKRDELLKLAERAGTIEYESLCLAGHARGEKVYIEI